MLNDQGQMNSSEKPEEKGPESGQAPTEALETAGRSAAPQPGPSDDDQKTIQNIQGDLKKSDLKQGTNQPSPPANATQAPKTAGSDKPYIKAAENIIEKDKEDPYQEEEDHEVVRVQYLHDRFGKDIKKS